MDVEFLTPVVIFGFTIAGAVIFGIVGIYQVKRHRKNVDIESKRHYYPLDFQTSSKYQIKRIDKDLYEIKLVRRGFVPELNSNPACAHLLHDIIFKYSDYHDHINGLEEFQPALPPLDEVDLGDEYKLKKRMDQRKNWWSEDWYLIKKNEVKRGNYISSIHFVKSKLNACGTNTVYFPLKNRFNGLIGSSIPLDSITRPQSSNSRGNEEVSSTSQRNYGPNELGTPFTNIDSSSQSPYSMIEMTSPYIDPSLKTNQYITRNDLGATERILDDLELFQFEERKLFRLIGHVNKNSKTTTFKVAKNSFEYKWRSNGYLEKNSKDNVYVATERIGFSHISKDKNTIIIYLNEDRLDKFSVLQTFFIHYFSSTNK